MRASYRRPGKARGHGAAPWLSDRARHRRRIRALAAPPLVNLHLALLIAYSSRRSRSGLWIGARVTKHQGDFFVAGRRLGPGLLFATMLAANIGAGSTVGAAGLGLPRRAQRVVVGRVRRVWLDRAGASGSVRACAASRPSTTCTPSATSSSSATAARVRGSIASLLWVGTLSILAGQLIAHGLVLSVVLGLPQVRRLPRSAALVMTIYFAAGGLLTSAWVNVVQLTVKLVGFALRVAARARRARAAGRGCAPCRPTRLTGTSGRAAARARSTSRCSRPPSSSRPALLQKVYGARDDRAVRIGVGVNAHWSCSLFAIVPVVLGMVARVLHPDLPEPRAGPADAAHARPAAGGRRARAGRGLLRGSERRRRRSSSC